MTVKYVILLLLFGFQTSAASSKLQGHRISIEWTSLSKETYTVKHPRKIYPSCDVFRVVDAFVGLSG